MPEVMMLPQTTSIQPGQLNMAAFDNAPSATARRNTNPNFHPLPGIDSRKDHVIENALVIVI
jgi:hypothetical protein